MPEINSKIDSKQGENSNVGIILAVGYLVVTVNSIHDEIGM